MKLVSKVELVNYLWRCGKSDGKEIDWFMKKRAEGFQIRLEEEHKLAASLGFKIDTIRKFIAQSNLLQNYNIPDFINSNTIPSELIGTEVELTFREIQKILSQVSNK